LKNRGSSRFPELFLGRATRRVAVWTREQGLSRNTLHQSSRTAPGHGQPMNPRIRLIRGTLRDA
jgi:hypothetical protein